MAQQPLAKIRAGAVSCALWENNAMVNGRSIVVMKASLDRRYKDGDGVWKSSNSFSRNEIPLALFCLETAFEKMIGEQQEERVPEEVVR